MTGSIDAIGGLQVHSALRASEAEIAALLDALDQHAPLRVDGRSAYRGQNVRFWWDSGPAAGCPVPTRWISDNGIGFLFGRFLYPGASCRIQPTTLYGSWQVVPSTVLCCRYFTNAVYEVELHFAQPIEAAMFSLDAVTWNILIVAEDDLAAALLASHVQGGRTQIESITDPTQAVEQALQRDFDLLLVFIQDAS